MFDRPAAGRAWFERTLPDQLDARAPRPGRDRVRPHASTARTPGRFHTKIFNRGVEPAIQVHYRASKVKQYFKEGRALRTETTVNDTRDFGIGRRLTDENWEALIADRPPDQPAAPRPPTRRRAIARQTPRRSSAWCCHPPTDGLPAPGLRFGEPRTMALLACLCCFQHLFTGLTNRITARADRRADPRLQPRGR